MPIPIPEKRQIEKVIKRFKINKHRNFSSVLSRSFIKDVDEAAFF